MTICFENFEFKGTIWFGPKVLRESNLSGIAVFSQTQSQTIQFLSCHVLWQRRRLCQIVWITSCNKLLLMLLGISCSGNCYSHSCCCFLHSVGAVALLSRMISMLLSRSSCFVLNISSKSFPKYGPWAFCYQIHTRPDDPEKLGQLRSGMLQIKSKLIAIAEGRYFSHLTDFFSRRNH